MRQYHATVTADLVRGHRAGLLNEKSYVMDGDSDVRERAVTAMAHAEHSRKAMEQAARTMQLEGPLLPITCRQIMEPIQHHTNGTVFGCKLSTSNARTKSARDGQPKASGKSNVDRSLSQSHSLRYHEFKGRSFCPSSWFQGSSPGDCP